MLFETPQFFAHHMYNLLPDCGYIKLHEAPSCAWRGSQNKGQTLFCISEIVMSLDPFQGSPTDINTWKRESKQKRGAVINA